MWIKGKISISRKNIHAVDLKFLPLLFILGIIAIILRKLYINDAIIFLYICAVCVKGIGEMNGVSGAKGKRTLDVLTPSNTQKNRVAPTFFPSPKRWSHRVVLRRERRMKRCKSTHYDSSHYTMTATTAESCFVYLYFNL